MEPVASLATSTEMTNWLPQVMLLPDESLRSERVVPVSNLVLMKPKHFGLVLSAEI